MKEEGEDKQGFKTIDRRRFDSKGEAKSTESSQKGGEKKDSEIKPDSPSESNSSDTVSGEKEFAALGDEEQSEATSMNFSSFVISLGTQALLQLGQMKSPEGLEVKVDRDAAKQVISILEMLQSKTKGNLESGESKLLEDIIHSLKMSFVKGKK